MKLKTFYGEYTMHIYNFNRMQSVRKASKALCTFAGGEVPPASRR